jgi:hypothetical protein
MSTDRRYALLQHQHTISQIGEWGLLGNGTVGYWDKLAYIGSDGLMEVGKYIDFHETDMDVSDYDYRIAIEAGVLNTSGPMLTGPHRILAPGSTLPASGNRDLSTGLVLHYGGDATYGLLGGVLGSGAGWLQAQRTDGVAGTYDLQLQPNGGNTYIPYGISGLDLAGVGNWNNLIGDSYINFRVGRASNGASNSPGAVDNANGCLSFAYHPGGYGVQFGFVDTPGSSFHVRSQQAGAWSAWQRVTLYQSTLRLTAPASISIPAGYGLYLNGGTDSVYLATSNVTYGSMRVGGSTNAWAGIYFDNSYRGQYLMCSGGGDAMGFFSELDGWKFHVAGGIPYATNNLYRIPYVTWATAGGGGSAVFSAGTGAPSGGADGDVHFRFGASRSLYIRSSGVWEVVAS